MRTLVLICLFLLFQLSCTDSAVLRFTVSAGERSYLDCPVSVELNAQQTDKMRGLQLYMESGGSRVLIPSELDWSYGQAILRFVIPGEFRAGEIRTFVFRDGDMMQDTSQSVLDLQESADELQFLDKGQPVLSYRKSEMLPPSGVDSLYKRSAYIHPLYSPLGEVLTRIQPPDHYHHYGIWNPWTKTHIKGREIDYWNLAKGQGTVRFAGWHFKDPGRVFSAVSAKQEHIDFGSGLPERVTMEEALLLRYWGRDHYGSRYILDKEMSYTNILSDTILFDAYRYGGGIGFRATEKWKKDNSTILTSEEKSRQEADGTRARWCIVEGESNTNTGRSGILFMSHPENREHPEPMRVWPADIHQGEVFFEFCPIRHNDWLILPGKTYTLKYRMVVFDGSMTAEEADMYWNGFAYPPEVMIIL